MWWLPSRGKEGERGVTAEEGGGNFFSRRRKYLFVEAIACDLEGKGDGRGGKILEEPWGGLRRCLDCGLCLGKAYRKKQRL